MAEHASDHTVGEMEIGQQATTFHHFLQFTKWGSLAVAVGVLMLTMWFCTDAGFLGGAVAGLVLLVAGILLLREKRHSGPAH
jgi:hypothetical protein